MSHAVTAPHSSRAALLSLAASLPLLTACLPNRVVIDLAPSDGKLKETQVLADKGATQGGAKIALIDVSGLISHSSSGGLIAGRGNSVDDLASRLAKAEEDPLVKAIVLRVNSPGGTVAASETMYRELRRFRQATEKPIVASMAEVAASGGYYISLAADRLIAQPTTITGSIGVIIQTINLSKGMAMIGIEGRAVTSGPNKDIANPLEPIRDEQYKLLQATVDDFYAAFKGLVVERRPQIPTDRLATATDGRVFTGRQALEIGLVDANGDLRDAFDAAKALAGVTKARLIKYHTDGRAPGSPYATAQSPLPSPSSLSLPGTQINLVQMNLPEGPQPAPGFYYLWAPSLP